MALGSARLTEKWINRGLWLIAFVFAGFLTGLGSLIVEDLPKVEKVPRFEEFVDQVPYQEAKRLVSENEHAVDAIKAKEITEERKLSTLRSNYNKSKENFDNWIATRDSTEDKNQNDEVLKRTKNLETEQNGIRLQEESIKSIQDEIEKKSEEASPAREKMRELEQQASEKIEKVERANQVKVFLYRLALTLPLLLIGAWLFVKKRKTKHWPFVWGFVIFAVFAFFVELVPYLPSYGGYVRYIVGIIMTLFIGQYSIKALQTYLEKQKLAEANPNTQLKENLNYETAQQRLSKGICPGCERPIDLKDPTRNFCIHCGTAAFNHCVKCNTRKNAFAKYCHSCGEPA